MLTRTLTKTAVKAFTKTCAKTFTRASSTLFMTLFLGTTAVLGILVGVMLSDKYAQHGIVTLKFDTAALQHGLISPSEARRERGLLEDIQSEVQSIARGAATAIPSVLSDLDSAVHPIATHAIPVAVSRIQSAMDSVTTPFRALEERMPRNCSIGTRQVCIGNQRSISCISLPLNLSDLVPSQMPGLPDAIGDEIGAVLRRGMDRLQPLADSLSTVTAWIRNLLVMGACLMLVVVALFFCSFFNCLSCIVHRGIWKALLQLGLGVVCCVPFVALSATYTYFREKAKHLPSWVEARDYELYGYSVGAMCCAIAMALLAAAAPVISSHFD